MVDNLRFSDKISRMAYLMHGLEIGRNDACRCGSGKKFKKCCMEKPYQSSPELLADLALGQQRLKEAGEFPMEIPAKKAWKRTIPIHTFAALAAGTALTAEGTEQNEWEKIMNRLDRHNV